MKFSIATAVFSCCVSAFASPAAPVAARDTATFDSASYAIEDFALHTYDGRTVYTMSFYIRGAGADFTCIPYDPYTGSATQDFQDGYVYACGEYTAYSFMYTEPDNHLTLYEYVNDYDTLAGDVYLPDTVCYDTSYDRICYVPSDDYVQIDLYQV